MPSRSFWKGYLKLSLVTCRVGMMPARTDGEKIRFHTINRETGNRIESQYVDSITREPVDADDQAKAYERAENDFIVIEEDDLDAVALESTRTIDIEQFVPASAIDSIWYDQPHYLHPDDAVGEEAFAVIREAMKASGTVGLSRLVLYRRERAVMLEPRDTGIVLWTLRYGDEVREAPEQPEARAEKTDSKIAAALKAAIKAKTETWTPSMSADPVQERLRALIASRKKAHKPASKRKSEKAPAHNVVNIMDALRKSVAEEKRAPRKH